MPNHNHDRISNFLTKPEVRTGIALSLLGAFISPLIIQLKSGVETQMGDKLILPSYCHSPNLQGNDPVTLENKDKNLKVEQTVLESKTCAELALKWFFDKYLFPEVLNPKITTVEQLDESVANIFQSLTKANKRFYPSLTDRNKGLLFASRPQNVEFVDQAIHNYLATPSQPLSSSSNTDNPLLFYLSAKLEQTKLLDDPNNFEVIDKALQELNYTRQSLMQKLQSHYSLRYAQLLKEAKGEHIKEEYDLIDRIVAEADIKVLIKSLAQQNLDFKTEDKKELSQKLKTHLQVLITTNKSIKFRLMQILMENNQLTHQSPQEKTKDRQQVQPNSKDFISLERQLRSGATIVNDTQTQGISAYKNFPVEGLGVDKILECPETKDCKNVVSSVWNKEAMRLMAITSYTFIQKEHFLRFLAENNTKADQFVHDNPKMFAGNNWLEGAATLALGSEEAKEAVKEIDKNKGLLNLVLTAPEKPLIECAIGCVKPLHDPMVQKYIEQMGLGVPTLEKLNQELAEMGLGKIETVYLSYLQDIDQIVKPVYMVVYNTVKACVFIAVEAVKLVITVGATITIEYIAPVVLEFLDPFLFDSLLAIELAASGGFIAKSSGVVNAAKLASQADDFIYIGSSQVAREIASDAPGLGATIPRNRLTSVAQEQLASFEARRGLKLEVFEVKNLGSFMTGRENMSVLEIGKQLRIVGEETGKVVFQVDKARYNYTKVREGELAQIISDNPKIAESFGFRKGAFDAPSESSRVKVADGVDSDGVNSGKKATDTPDNIPSTVNQAKNLECIPTVAGLTKTSDGFLIAVKERVMRLLIEPAEAAKPPCTIENLGLSPDEYKYNPRGMIVPKDTPQNVPKIGNKKPRNWEWADSEYPPEILELNMKISNFQKMEPSNPLKQDIIAGKKSLRDVGLSSEQRIDLGYIRKAVRDKGKVGVKYDDNGRIELADFAEAEVNIGNFSTNPNKEIARANDKDAAVKAYIQKYGKNPPKGYDAHHGNSRGQILWVNDAVHGRYAHTGGFAIYNVSP